MPNEPMPLNSCNPVKPKRKGSPRIIILPADLATLLRRHAEGESEVSLARAFGVSRHVVRARLLTAGATIRGFAQNKKVIADRSAARLASLPAESIITDYQNGRSLRSLAHELQTSMTMIKRRLVNAGIPLRGDHELLAARVRTEDARGHNPRAAHFQVGQGEEQTRDLLWAQGLRPVRQGVVGPYNIDLLLPSVAVEVHRQGRHPLHTERERRRIEKLTDWGWDVFYIWITPSHPLSQAAAEQLLAFIESADRNPTRRGRYRVVRGCGQLVATGCGDLDNESGIIASE